MTRRADLLAELETASPALGWRLVDPLLRDRRSVVAEAAAFLLLGVIGFLRGGSVLYLGGSAVIVAIGAWRLLLARNYRRAREATPPRRWAWWAIAGACLAGAGRGGWSVITLLEPSAAMAFAVIATQCLSAGVLAVRQQSLRTAAAGQALLTLGPALAACIASSNIDQHRCAGLVAACIAVILPLIWVLHSQTVRLLRADADVVRLAGRLDIVTKDREVIAKHLESMIVTDQLTGLANRRACDLVLAREWRRGVREQSPLSLLMFGLDEFAAGNDTHSATAREACLKEVAAIVGTAVRRPGDAVAYYHDAQFAIVLPDTWSDGAVRVGRQLLATLAERGQRDAASPLAGVSGSIGVASLIPQAADGSERLVVLAESALGCARDTGRNRVQLAEAESMPVPPAITEGVRRVVRARE